MEQFVRRKAQDVAFDRSLLFKRTSRRGSCKNWIDLTSPSQNPAHEGPNPRRHVVRQRTMLAECSRHCFIGIVICQVYFIQDLQRQHTRLVPFAAMSADESRPRLEVCLSDRGLWPSSLFTLAPRSFKVVTACRLPAAA